MVIIQLWKSKYNLSAPRDFGRSNYFSLPLAVCIAGYRNYSTSYTLVNVDGAGNYGIFGVNSSDFGRCESVCRILWRSPLSTEAHENLQGDLRCLVNVIFDDPYKMKMYETLCSPPAVNNVTCKDDSGLVVNIFDPKHKNLFTRAFEIKQDPLDIFEKWSDSGNLRLDAPVSTILLMLTLTCRYSCFSFNNSI